jgi:hydroxymethyl cephem carbamoyltransferase
MTEGLPILVSGGCGLNCDWNSGWRESGLFEDVFVQPCTNDSGSAIGTAVDAQFHHTGNAKIEWTVYAGEAFVHDDADLSGFDRSPLVLENLVDELAGEKVFAWVNGRYEIGPRALGNRSLIAAPFTGDMHRRLNAIKKREGFRPIAPIVMEEELDRLFNNHGPSPHMLYFQTVRSDALKAVTHVDGSARAQTVTREQNLQMYELLGAFRARTGYGVLCNTSLNFNGKGFINRMSDLVRYALMTGLDGFVVDGTLYRRKDRS